MEDKLLDILLNDANITGLLSNRIYPVQLDNGNRYPALAYIIEVEAKERCTKGVMFAGELILILESKTREDLKLLRRHLINALDGVDVFRFVRFGDDFEKTSKTYMCELYFNIIRVNLNEL